MSSQPTSQPTSPVALPPQQVRDLLPRAWHAFFARFGRLSGIQRVAVAPIARGRNVLVVAPTATGKTEAVMAPLAERLLGARYERPRAERDEKRLETLVISPTRALCNDLARRLQRPLRAAGISLGIKTGDSPNFNDKAPPSVLVTTPESLDSMLSRRPRALREVRAVALDELHLIARSGRGDQLQILMARLDRVSKHPVQRVAASATVPDSHSLGEIFLGNDVVVAQDQERSQRKVAATTETASNIEEATWSIEALYEGAGSKRKKVLVFANTRQNVEELAAALGQRPTLQGHVFAHHGSVARAERLRVEKAFLDAPAAICVATMTLELGIDIGDIDYVVLVAPPPNVASLLQRVGRSNRKGDTTHVLCLHATEFEDLRFQHLLQCAARGELFAEQVAPRPTAIAQQAISLLFQNPKRFVTVDALHGRLPASYTDLYSRADVELILRQMVVEGWLRRVDRGRFVAEGKTERAYQYGRMHSLITDNPEIEVLDESTGRKVGTVRLTKKNWEALDAGRGFDLALAGRTHTASRMRERKLYVSGADAAGEANFIAREAPRYSFGLARSLAAFLDIEADTVPFRGNTISHFQGTVYGVLFRWVLRERGLDTGTPGDWGPFFGASAYVPEGPLDEDPAELLKDVMRALDTRVGDLVRLLQPGPYLECIPDTILRRWVEASVDFRHFAERLAATRIVS